MSIDVIVPCYNAHSTIDRLLASIAMQTVEEDITVYLIDDCSEKGYGEVLGKWGDLLAIELITLTENVGPGAARQVGLDEGSGDFVVFCDADDTLTTAHAIEILARTMNEKNADVVSGNFIEECEDHTFVPHTSNMVWMFGKMYRRRTIERFLLRFNNTRANEDTGFNTVLSKLTDNIVDIPQTVYTWHFSPATITRRNKGEYTWASGHVGYIDNMIWAVDELRKRNINKEIIRELATSVLCKLYFMHEDVYASSIYHAQESAENIQRYYDSAVKPIVLEGAMHFSYVAEMYKKVAVETMKNQREAEIMHKVAFRDYLRNLGYYDDVKQMEANFT